MTLRRFAAVLLLAFGVLCADNAPLWADAADELFNESAIQEIRLSINSRDLAQLRARYTENTYYPADIKWNNTTVRNVGVRSRGTGSRRPDKMGLLVDMDRYARDQTFVGLSALVLDNMWQDPALMKETLTMKVFRRMGQPAPREAYAKLFINNEFQGLYSLVEPIDTKFAARALGDSTGYLYEYHYRFPFFGEYLGDDFGPYKPIFEPQNHELESDSTLYGPIRDLFREANGPDDAVWLSRVDALIDLKQFVTHVAIQGCIVDNDGILGAFGINNFYLHRPANSTRFRILPWDEDFTFEFLDTSALRRGNNERDVPLFARAFAEPEVREAFINAEEQCAHAIGDDQWLLNEVDKIVNLIYPTVLQDTKKQFSNDQFIETLDFIRRIAVERPAILFQEVENLRAGR